MPLDAPDTDLSGRFRTTAFWRALPAGMRRRWWMFRPLDLIARHWPVFKKRRGVLVVRMDGIGDMVLFRRALDHYAEAFGVEDSDITVLGCTSWGDIADAVEALHLGAWDYILKPIEDMAVLLHAVHRALERARLIRQDREHQKHLEREVKSRTSQLETAYEDLAQEMEKREQLVASLETQNAELERFVYTVSHDLKTPLVTIKWLLGQLEQEVAEGHPSEIRHTTKRMKDAADRMVELLGDVLELSRIGRQTQPPEDVALEDLANEVLELTAGQIAQRQVHVALSPDLPVLHGDRARLREVLQNLVENAVKFMGDQPEPRIEIGIRRDCGETVCYVRDNGLGIDPRYHEKVFGLFDQLNQRVEGTGVGLTLVKRIVEIHGGRVWIESSGLGQGATFCFTIRPKPEQASPSPESAK